MTPEHADALATALGMIRARLAGDAEAEMALMHSAASGMTVFHAVFALAIEGFELAALLNEEDVLDVVDAALLTVAALR